jgi:ribonuclease E
MLIEATHPEETRVVVVDGKRLEEFDYESANKRQLKGNIYLAKITRVEPSLQAAFVDYGGNRHGFLAFSEIHPDYYRIPVADREALLAEHAAMAAADAASDNDEEDLAVNVRADLAAGTAETTDSADTAPADDSDDDGDNDDDDGGDETSSGDEAGDALPLTMSTERLFGPEIESAAEPGPGDQVASDSPTDGAGNGPATRRPRYWLRASRSPQAGGAEPRGTRSILETVAATRAEDVTPAFRPQRRYKIQEVIKRRRSCSCR